MFHIIADSACDLTPEMAAELNIEIIPFFLSVDGKEYKKEGTEMKIRDFYQYMVDYPDVFPKTSLPSINDFQEMFMPHVEAGEELLCICFTGKMSGGVGSARNARDIILEEHPDAKIIVLDSHAATVSESIYVQNACAMRDAGKSLEETAEWLEANYITNEIFFTDGNLDYLIKGGRIGRATGRVANLLNLKPLIHFKDGEVDSVSVARGRAKSMVKIREKLMAYLEERHADPDDYGITVGYGYDEEEGYTLRNQLKEALKAKFPNSLCKVGILQIGATISCHNGPYPLGVGVMKLWRE